MPYPVKWLSSEMEGAPNMGQAVAVNQLIPVLKAILVDGFGARAVTSAAYNTTTQQITYTFAAAHKYLIDSVIVVAGATEADYNGEFRVVAVTNTSVTVANDNGTPTANSATGTLTMKVAPLGWKIVSEDTTNNRIVFASNDPNSNDLALHVDNGAYTDNGGWNGGQTSGSFGIRAKVRIVNRGASTESFTTESGPHPWPASHKFAADEWFAVGDPRLFYFLPAFSIWGRRELLMFGDGVSNRAGDRFMTLLTCHSTWGSGSSDSNWMLNNNISNGRYSAAMRTDSDAQKVLARDHHQLPGAIGWRPTGSSVAARLGLGLAYPNPSDNGFYVQAEPPMVISQNKDFRGYLPGIRNCWASDVGLDKGIIKNMPNLPGKSLLCLLAANEETPSTVTYVAGTNVSILCFDITGPWR